MKKALVIVLLPLLFSACATTTAPSSPQAANKSATAAKKQRSTAPSLLRQLSSASLSNAPEPLPDVALTPDILYKLLTAEVAVQRGEWQAAYVATLALAQQTRDPRLAQRAMEIALGAKKHDEALAAVRLWRGLAPDSEHALQYFLGFVIMGDNLADAKPILEQRLRESPAEMRGAAMLQMQRLLARAKDKTAGFTLLQEVLTPYLNQPQARLALAHGALTINDLPRARQEALAALATDPESEQAALMLVQATPDRAEAGKILQDFLNQYPKARDVRLAYARMLVEQKQYPASRREFEILLKDNPRDLTVLFALGILAAQANDSQAAEKHLTDYITEMTANPDEERDPTQALLLLSQLAEERKDTETALKWLNMIEPGEAYVGAQVKRAHLLAKRGDLVGARKLLMETRTDSDADQVKVAMAEAHILRDAGRLPEALAVLEAAVKRFPDNTDLLYDYAMLAEKANKLEDMEQALRKIMTLDPKNQHAYNALGYSLADRNLRLPEAYALLVKALELAPDDPFIMDSMGWVNFRMGRLKEAEELLRRAYSLRADAEIAVHLGEVLWVKGQKEEAQKFWRDAKSRDPQNDTLKSTLLRLQVSL